MLFVSSCSVLSRQGGLLVFFSLSSFTMSLSSGDNGSVLECVARGPGLAVEFHAGWEGWLEGARSAQLASDRDDVVCVAVLHACHRPWPYGGKHSLLKAAIR